MIVGELRSDHYRFRFGTADSRILTFRDMEMKHAARVSTHDVYGRGGLTEFTGNSPTTLSFKVLISNWLGVDAYKEYKYLAAMTQEGLPCKLVVGGGIVGRYKWLIQSTDGEIQYFSPAGRAIQYDATLSLIEYLKG